MRKIISFFLACNTIFFFVFLSLYSAGSLEMFLSEEKEAGSRLVWGLLLGAALIIEVWLIMLLKHK